MMLIGAERRGMWAALTPPQNDTSAGCGGCQRVLCYLMTL